MSTVYDEIKAERDRQDTLWGHDFDNKNTINDWVAYIAAYASRAAFTDSEVLNEKTAQQRELLVKTAALAVAAIETIDRLGKLASRHYDV